MNSAMRPVNTDLSPAQIRKRLEDKIEHLTSRMRILRADKKNAKLHQWAKVELSVAERRLKSLNEKFPPGAT